MPRGKRPAFPPRAPSPFSTGTCRCSRPWVPMTQATAGLARCVVQGAARGSLGPTPRASGSEGKPCTAGSGGGSRDSWPPRRRARGEPPAWMLSHARRCTSRALGSSRGPPPRVASSLAKALSHARPHSAPPPTAAGGRAAGRHLQAAAGHQTATLEWGLRVALALLRRATTPWTTKVGTTKRPAGLRRPRSSFLACFPPSVL